MTTIPVTTPTLTSAPRPEREKAMQAQWENEQVFARSLKRRQDSPAFCFYEGPPTANGRPGAHHVLARTFKDAVCRFQDLQGSLVERRAGWDCHGLPVELEAERRLGFTSKSDVEIYGLAAFSAECRAAVGSYRDDWERMTERLGFWLDHDNSYATLDNSYVESVWWTLKEVYDRGRLYEGDKVVPWCPRCETTLSSHELAQPDAYQEVNDLSAVVRFETTDGAFLVWTTTPWTLVANQALAVNPQLSYARVSWNSAHYWLAQAAVDELTPGGVIEETCLGADLVGREYQPLFSLVTQDRFEVVAADFVTADEGSGVVHLAPAFGADDFAALKDRLEVVNPVASNGHYATGPFAGREIYEAQDELLKGLTVRGLLHATMLTTHPYPHCWRCQHRLLYWAKRGWYARTTAVREQMLQENATVDWHPDHVQAGRFGRWLENTVDWAVSRERYWGTPLPLWRCPNNHVHCVGSRAELASLGADVPDDLHRPAVDAVTFACPTCQEMMHRVSEVLDVWWDSGAMPYAQVGFPASGADLSFPADFVCEALDQTRGWFYSLLAVSCLMDRPVPYRRVLCLGLVLDGEGHKMSKSVGNVVDPWQIFDEFGADVFRWFYLAKSPWEGYQLDENSLKEAAAILTTVDHCQQFLTTIERVPADTDSPHLLDQWLRAAERRVVVEVTAAFSNYDFARGCQTLAKFVDDLSNWWLRLSRQRLRDQHPGVAEHLADVLATLAQLLAPLTPFAADELWRGLGQTESVHLGDWPTAATLSSDDAVLTAMALARRVVELGHSERARAGVNTRQPLREVQVFGNEAERQALAPLAEVVCDELNVNEMTVLDQAHNLGDWQVLPNWKQLGPRFRADMPAVKAALNRYQLIGPQAAAGGLALNVGERMVLLAPEDYQVRFVPHPGQEVGYDHGLLVALDFVQDRALQEEGFLRELSAQVQRERKAQGRQAGQAATLVVDGDSDLVTLVTGTASWFTEKTSCQLVVSDLPHDCSTVMLDQQQLRWQVSD